MTHFYKINFYPARACLYFYTAFGCHYCEIHLAVLGKLSRSLSQQLYSSKFEFPFWIISVLK